MLLTITWKNLAKKLSSPPYKTPCSDAHVQDRTSIFAFNGDRLVVNRFRFSVVALSQHGRVRLNIIRTSRDQG